MSKLFYPRVLYSTRLGRTIQTNDEEKEEEEEEKEKKKVRNNIDWWCLL